MIVLEEVGVKGSGDSGESVVGGCGSGVIWEKEEGGGEEYGSGLWGSFVMMALLTLLLDLVLQCAQPHCLSLSMLLFSKNNIALSNSLLHPHPSSISMPPVLDMPKPLKALGAHNKKQ